MTFDHGEPLGRVDLDYLSSDTSQLVLSYMTQQDDQAGLYVRSLAADGVGKPTLVAQLSGRRSDGCPRLAAVDDGVLLAYTVTDEQGIHVKVARVELQQKP